MVNVIRAIQESAIEHHYRLVARQYVRTGRDWRSFPHHRFMGNNVTFYVFVWTMSRLDYEDDMLLHIIELQDAAIAEDFGYLRALSNRSCRSVFAHSCGCLLTYYLRTDRLFEWLERSMRGQYIAERTLERWVFGP